MANQTIEVKDGARIRVVGSKSDLVLSVRVTDGVPGVVQRLTPREGVGFQDVVRAVRAGNAGNAAHRANATRKLNRFLDEQEAAGRDRTRTRKRVLRAAQA